MTDIDTTPWRALSNPDEVAGAIVELYERRGTSTYDEAITQSEHALQTASYAMAAGAPDTAVVAALLHDVGHLLMADAESSDRFREIDLHHEQVGSRFLANWFGAAVTTPVALHVAAKRYLCATDTGYHSLLSPASVNSLALQGGPMTADEVAEFEAVEHHGVAVDLRRWDDQGKIPHAPTPPMEVFQELMVDVLTARP